MMLYNLGFALDFSCRISVLFGKGKCVLNSFLVALALYGNYKDKCISSQ